ncbi:MAG: prolyl oligopeptidase family serine peptidase [Acidobacteriota bacterium]
MTLLGILTSRYRQLLCWGLLLLGTVACTSSLKTPESVRRPSKNYTIEQFMATTTVTGASFSHDEKSILFSSNESGIFNAYSVPLSGGKTTALTRSTIDSTFAVSCFPKDSRILFTRDQGGNENNHVYVLEKDGQEKDLTPGEKVKAFFGGWSEDDQSFFVATNERDARFFDLYKVDAATYRRDLFYQDKVGYQLGDISRDQGWIAFDKSNTTSDSDVYLYHVATRQMKHISPHREAAQYRTASFDPGSKQLYYLTNDNAEFTRVRRYDLATGKHEEVEKADWDIFYTYFSRNGKYRVTGINEDAKTVIKIVDTQSGTPILLPNLPEGEITSVTISRSEAQMAFYLNGDRAPNNLYHYNFQTRKFHRLTDTLSKEIDADDLVESQVVRFQSFDGMTVPNVLYKPHQATEQSKAPALVWVHGGPGGQTRKGYSSLVQYLTNHGYVVLGINNRGSSGYGKSFFIADDRKHGREPLWDCVEGKKYLASLPYVDGERIGIIGGSYGGYMVLAALAFQPEVFAVGVDIFGISNWVRTLESIPPYWESFRLALYQEIGDPKKDREGLLATSPLFHAEKIQKPLMVLQGANDPRVIKPESDDIVAAVKKNGVPVEYVVFEDEGHGFTKKKNQIEGNRAILNFLNKHLKGESKQTAIGTPTPRS